LTVFFAAFFAGVFLVAIMIYLEYVCSAVRVNLSYLNLCKNAHTLLRGYRNKRCASRPSFFRSATTCTRSAAVSPEAARSKAASCSANAFATSFLPAAVRCITRARRSTSPAPRNPKDTTPGIRYSCARAPASPHTPCRESANPAVRSSAFPALNPFPLPNGDYLDVKVHSAVARTILVRSRLSAGWTRWKAGPQAK